MNFRDWKKNEPVSLEIFSEALSVSKPTSEQEAALQKFISQFGYDTYLFGVGSLNPDAKIHRFFFVSNMCPEWLSEYSENGYELHDVTLLHCIRNDVPMLWSALIHQAMNDPVSDELHYAVQRAMDYGYLAGVSLPLRVAWSPHSFGMSLSLRGSSDFKGHDEMFTHCNQKILAGARLFLTLFDMTERFSAEYGLTNQEQSVLRTSFAAHTNKDIVRVLGIAETTVRKHWSNINQKLDTSSKTEAMIVALGLGAMREDPMD